MTLGFYFNGTRCVGCRACTIACRDYKDVPVGVAFRKVMSFKTGSFPTATMYHYSLSCNHCDNPACVAVCPTGAMYKADDGTVQHNDDECIGCQSCVNACPMRALKFGDIDELAAEFGPDLVQELPFLPAASVTSPNTLIRPREAHNDTTYKAAMV